MEDWPDVVKPMDIAGRLRLGGERPDKAVRDWLRRIHPQHVRYQRWEFTPAEAERLVSRWHNEHRS